MKDLTVLRFLQIILEDNPELQSIIGSEISYIKSQLEDSAIQPELSSREFYAVARQYPSFVHVTETKIVISNGRELKKRLEQKLVFSQDAEMNKQVVAIWKKRKGF